VWPLALSNCRKKPTFQETQRVLARQDFLKYSVLFQSRDSSVGIALGYGLDYWGSKVRFPAGAGNFSLHHRVQNGSGADPASYPVGTRGSFLGGKEAGAWSWPLTSIYCRGKRMSGALPPLSQYAFIAWCSDTQGQLYLFTFVSSFHMSTPGK
jgi:hypothetical protein